MFSYCISKMKKNKILLDLKPLQAHTHLKRYQNVCLCSKRIYITSFLKRNEGSAVLEAALILPLFIFAMLFIYSIGCVICTKTVVYEAMQETVQYMAEYAYLYETVEDCSIGACAANTVTAYRKLNEYIDDKEFVDKYVSGSTGGIMVSRAEVDGDGYICMDIAYQISIDIPILGSWNKGITERIRQKAYLGSSMLSEKNQEMYVYVAENQSVYHTTRNCYHIKLSVIQISEQELAHAYSALAPCDFCVKDGNVPSAIYVTSEGNKYHYSKACRGLKRTVYRVKKSECQGLPACSNCGN